MSEQKLDDCNMSYMVQGEARYIINEIVDLAPGSLLVLPRGSTRKGITFPDRSG